MKTNADCIMMMMIIIIIIIIIIFTCYNEKIKNISPKYLDF